MDEAARITRAAGINYTDTHPLVRAFEKDNFAPFITFPLQAIGQYLKQAALRPDLIYTGTGQRARDFLDRIADDHGRIPCCRKCTRFRKNDSCGRSLSSIL